MSINKKLSEIQKNIHAPKIQRNKFGNYDYRKCEDILQAVKPLLGGCSLVMTDEIVAVGERIYVKATAILSDGEDYKQSSAYAREPEIKKGMDACQISGSASSYARKYALGGLLLIDDNRDLDSMDNSYDEDKINEIILKFDSAKEFITKSSTIDELQENYEIITKFFIPFQKNEKIAEFLSEISSLRDSLRLKIIGGSDVK
jgi:hypothetical protein